MLHSFRLRFFVVICYGLLLCAFCDVVQDLSNSIEDKNHPKIKNQMSDSKINNLNSGMSIDFSERSNIDASKITKEKEKSIIVPDQSLELEHPRAELDSQQPSSLNKPSHAATINKVQYKYEVNETSNVDSSMSQETTGSNDPLKVVPAPVNDIPISDEGFVNKVPSEPPNVEPKLNANPNSVEPPGQQMLKENIGDANVKKPENVKPSRGFFHLDIKNVGSLLEKGMKKLGVGGEKPHKQPSPDLPILPEDFENSTINEFETIPSINEQNDLNNELAPIPKKSNLQKDTPSNLAHASENHQKESMIENLPENNSVKSVIDNTSINQSDINNVSFQSSDKTSDINDLNSDEKLAASTKSIPVLEKVSDVIPRVATTQNATFHSNSEMKDSEISNSYETLNTANATKTVENISNRSSESMAQVLDGASSQSIKPDDVREPLESSQANVTPVKSSEEKQQNDKFTNSLPEQKSSANISNDENVANSNGAKKNFETGQMSRNIPQENELNARSMNEDVPNSSIELNSPATAADNENISKSSSTDLKNMQLDLKSKSDHTTDVGTKPVYEMDSESALNSENINNFNASENTKLDDVLKSDKTSGIVEDSSSFHSKSCEPVSETVKIVSESDELSKSQPGLEKIPSHTVARNIPSKPSDEKDFNSDVTATHSEETKIAQNEKNNIAADALANTDFVDSKMDDIPINSKGNLDHIPTIYNEPLNNNSNSSQESFHKAESDSAGKLISEQINSKSISSQESFHKAESDSVEKLISEQTNSKSISSQESFHKAESDPAEKLILEQINNKPISSQESFHKYESGSTDRLIIDDETNQSTNFVSEPTANVSLLREMYGIIEVGIRMGLNLSSQIFRLTDSYGRKSNITCVNGDCKNLLFSEINADINPLRFWVIVCTLFCVLVPSFWFFIFNNSSEMRKKISVAKINELEKRLFDATTQIKLLKSKVRDRNSDECSDYEIEFVELKSELDNFRVENAQLRNKINFLEDELQNRLTAESDENKELISKLEEEIDKLKTEYASSEKEVAVLRNKLSTLEFEKLIIKKECDDAHNSLQKFEVENHLLRKTETDLREKNQNLVSQLDNRNKTLVQLQSKYSDELIQIKCKADESALSLHLTQCENRELVREYDQIIASIKSGNISKDIRELVSLKAKATSLEDINLKLKSLLAEEKSKCVELQGTIMKLNADMSEVTRARDDAQKDCQDLEDKITFFKELLKKKKKKCSDIKKQLEELKKNDPSGICGGDEQLSKRFTSLCNEVDSYKLQVQRLQKEITDQEVDYKAKILNLEQKKHEYWLEWRNVERKYKNSEQEAANLRNKILSMESDSTSYNNLEKLNSHDNSNEVSMSLGDGSSIPSPVPFSPPPPLPYYSSAEFNAAPPLSDGFIPPPPLHEAFYPPEPIYMLPSDERLPPVGSRHDSNYYPTRGGEAPHNGFPPEPLNLYPETPMPPRKSHRYNGYNNRRTNRAGSSSSKSTESLSHHSTRN